MNAVQYIAFKDELKKIGATGFGAFKTGLNVGQMNKLPFSGVKGKKPRIGKPKQPK